MTRNRQTSYPPLHEVTQEVLDTDAAAFYSGLSPKTLRQWSSNGKGPILPDLKIGGRNRYKVSSLRQILCKEVA